MRPLVTWLLVGAVVTIALFAARDALRKDARVPAARAPTRFPAGPPRIAGRDDLARELMELGAAGTLAVTDGTCRRYMLDLPDLHWATPAGLPGPDCGFLQSPLVDEGSGVSAEEANPGTIEVFSAGWRYSFGGTAPAFKPDGTLTFVRDGRLFEWSASCDRAEVTVTFHGLRATPRCERAVAGTPPLLQEVAWLGGSDYAALAGPQGAASLLAVRRGLRLSIFRAVGTRLSSLEASPEGRYLAVNLGGELALFDSRRVGQLLAPPGAERPRAVTWSPDDRLTAVATESYVFVYPSGRSQRAVALPLAAIHLGWR